MAFVNGESPGDLPLPVIVYSYSAIAPPAAGPGSRTAARATRVQLQQQSEAIDSSSGINLVTVDEKGFGLDRPYLGWNAYPTAEETTPPVNTTSGSFVSLWTVSSEPQHPKVRVRVRVVNGAGTSGEVRLTDRVSGTVISSVLVVGSAATVEEDLDGTLINPILSSVGGIGVPMKVDVQARRTAGANTVAVLLLHVLGKGT